MSTWDLHKFSMYLNAGSKGRNALLVRTHGSGKKTWSKVTRYAINTGHCLDTSSTGCPWASTPETLYRAEKGAGSL